MKGYEIIKVKEWTDKYGRTHKRSVGGWFGNPFLSIGCPLLVAIIIGLGVLLLNPLEFPFIAIVLVIFLVGYFIFSLIYDFKMKYVWTEKNGWKTTSLPKTANKRIYHNEYDGYKIIREETSGIWTWYAHNTSTGDHIEYPEKTPEIIDIKKMYEILKWLEKQIDMGENR